jgi:hypothetical protein
MASPKANLFAMSFCVQAGKDPQPCNYHGRDRSGNSPKKIKEFELVFVFSFFPESTNSQPSHDPPCNYHGRDRSGNSPKKEKKEFEFGFCFFFFSRVDKLATEP